MLMAVDCPEKHQRRVLKWPNNVLCYRVYQDAIKKGHNLQRTLTRHVDRDFHEASCLSECDTAWNESWQHKGRKNYHSDTTWGCSCPDPVLTSEKALAHNTEPRQLNCCFMMIAAGWLFFLQHTLAHLSCSRSCLQPLAPSHYILAGTGSSQETWQNSRIKQCWKQWNEAPRIHTHFFCAAFERRWTFLAAVQAFSLLSHCYARGQGSMVESRKHYNCLKRGQ